MKYFEKSASLAAVLFLAACGGGGGGSSPLELTVASFTEFKLTENAMGSWPIEASVNKSSSPIAHSISGGADSSSFTISGNSLSFKGIANYEAPSDLNKDGVYELSITTSSGSASSTQTIYIRVTDVAESPVISTKEISNVSENITAIATIAASDEDINSNLSYSLFDSSGAKDESLLAIDSATGSVTFLSAPNFESPSDLNSDNTINFSVIVTDGSLSSQADYTFNITNVNESPVIATTDITNISEGSTSVITIAASDPDAESVLSYSLVNSSSVMDEGLLSIDASSGAIIFSKAPDYEGPTDVGLNNTIEFSVQVSDGSLDVTQAYSFVITNKNEAPVISSTAFSIAEQSTAVGTLLASDPDAGASLSYSLASGIGAVDDAKFSINASTGAISFLVTPDYESPTDNGLDNTYNLTVNVSDGSLSTSQSIAIAVGNVSEAPSFSISSEQSYAENSGLTFSATASDPDGSPIQYELGGVDASRFNISSSGSLSFASAPDYESPGDNGSDNTYNVRIEAFDGSSKISVSLVITITDDTGDNFGIKLPAKVAIAELKKES